MNEIEKLYKNAGIEPTVRNSKYIIKNCPGYNYGLCSSSNINEQGCVYCTNCVIKQIVERCRKEQEYHKKWQKEFGFNYADLSGLKFANDILKLLDIQEVE